MSPITERLHGRTGAEYVADESGKFAGQVVISKKRDFAIIGRIHVAPEFRGRGIAHQLLEHAESWARQEGCRKIKSTLIPEVGSERTLKKFFENNGYSVDRKGNAKKNI